MTKKFFKDLSREAFLSKKYSLTVDEKMVDVREILFHAATEAYFPTCEILPEE